jgi:hypothetical protein
MVTEKALRPLHGTAGDAPYATTGEIAPRAANSDTSAPPLADLSQIEASTPSHRPHYTQIRRLDRQAR